jgi:diguanylate cyclase
MVLPQMAKHGGMFYPTHYMLWYEYFAGLNPRLRAALSTRLEQPKPLTSAEVDEFYMRYIAARDNKQAEKLQEALEAMLQKLRGVATTAGQQSEEYSRQLEEAARALSRGMSTAAQGKLVGALIRKTADAKAAASTMNVQIETSVFEVAELRKQLGQVQNEAATDPLTSLLNRRGFDRDVAALMVSRKHGLFGCSLLIGDIDHFKRVNDTYGHPFGDQVIKGVAQIIKQVVKGEDMAARLGGEEFAVLLPDTPLQGAMSVAERIRKAVGKTRITKSGADGVANQITLSLGVAAAEDGDSLEGLLKRADRALYRAKQSGRNRVKCAAQAA